MGSGERQYLRSLTTAPSPRITATICVSRVCDSNATSCSIIATPLHMACVYAGRGDPNYSDIIKRLLLDWKADRDVPVVCGTCPSGVICDCPYVGLTAREILNVEDDFLPHRQNDCALFIERPQKRVQRGPVKDRATKLAVELPPTPVGVRKAAANKSLSPETRKTAKWALQRHQKACHQKVQRAEEIAATEAEWGKKRRDGIQLRHYYGL